MTLEERQYIKKVIKTMREFDAIKTKDVVKLLLYILDEIQEINLSLESE